MNINFGSSFLAVTPGRNSILEKNGKMNLKQANEQNIAEVADKFESAEIVQRPYAFMVTVDDALDKDVAGKLTRMEINDQIKFKQLDDEAVDKKLAEWQQRDEEAAAAKAEMQAEQEAEAARKKQQSKDAAEATEKRKARLNAPKEKKATRSGADLGYM